MQYLTSNVKLQTIALPLLYHHIPHGGAQVLLGHGALYREQHEDAAVRCQLGKGLKVPLTFGYDYIGTVENIPELIRALLGDRSRCTGPAAHESARRCRVICS